MTQASENGRKRVLIVGGVAGGASTAARVRRLSEDAEVVVFERGEHISFANCGMPYHIGGAIPERDRLLVQTPEAMKNRYRIDVRTRHEVTEIDPEGKTITVRNLETGKESTERYDALVLSPGAEPVRPPIPGIDHERVMTLRSLNDMDRIKKVVDEESPRRAVVVGGGYIGLEMTEALRERGVDVTLVELAEQVFSPADAEMVAPVHQQLEMHGVDLRLGTSITAIREEGQAGELSARLSSGEGVACDMIIMAVGVKPESKLAKDAGLEIAETGGIAVDKRMRTSVEDIYAVGDAVKVTHMVSEKAAQIPLAGPANRQGRVAADNIFGRQSEYHSTQGTAICKVFDLAIGVTGLNERDLVKLGKEYEKVFVHPASHAGYYPGAAQMSLKLLFHPRDGTIYGAQAVGGKGVDKRIDVLAVAMRAGLTVRDLQEQELSYAPPYGSAKDPINYAGFVASNVIDGDMKICHVADVLHPGPDQLLLDVRTEPEVDAGTIPGAKNIPLDELRNRLDELPAGKEILVFCQVGLRGYLAYRLLDHNGLTARNLTGGYKTYRAVTGMLGEQTALEADMTEDTGETESKAPAEAPKAEVVEQIDARALQCPGPIMRLKNAIDEIQQGQAVSITASDPGFPADVESWCRSTGNTLLERTAVDGSTRATIVKGVPAPSPAAASGGSSRQKTMVVFSGDFDKAMASFIIANGAASMGSDVTMFFTFWGLNILRKPGKVSVAKNAIEKMFGKMMPRGADRLKLSQMNMGGMGLKMIKDIMRKKNVQSLPELIDSAKAGGVKLVACSMSMDLMGIRKEELIDGVEEGGVARYLESAEKGNVNLFI